MFYHFVLTMFSSLERSQILLCRGAPEIIAEKIYISQRAINTQQHFLLRLIVVNFVAISPVLWVQIPCSHKDKKNILWPLRAKATVWVQIDESTKRYAIASRLNIYWWIFMGNTPKDSWFQQLSFEVSILKIRL